MNNQITVLIIVLISLYTASCSGGGSTETQETEITTIQPTMGEEKRLIETDTLKNEVSEESSDDRINGFRDKYAEGTWEYDVLDFMESKEMSMIFELDKVPFEGDELPTDAEEQLDHLSDISLAFTELHLEVKAHTTAASNKVERTAKKATSKARALWVSTKLNFKGLPTERLSSTGMADEELLEDVAPDDKKQKRIVARLTKVQE